MHLDFLFQLANRQFVLFLDLEFLPLIDREHLHLFFYRLQKQGVSPSLNLLEQPILNH